MGNGRSIFGMPEVCSKCNRRDPGLCVWRVNYENSEVSEYNKHDNIMIQIVKAIDMKNDPLSFACKEAKKIEHIVGSIRVSLGIDVSMTQFFCDSCHTELQQVIEQLPEEWDYEGHYNANGHEHISLP